MKMSLWSVRRNRVDKYLCTSRLGPSDLPDDMWRMDQVNTNIISDDAAERGVSR